ncbi:SIS domain-containing protein [Lachnoclostridium pacaense]|uniref:SIS domain-containing protein n=1 Tax=Enterocloster hominis (ex Hitch et al. 2024) TaxID=1917870 RepID=UPI001D112EAC|nr:SIS domain-containing protein [Lachnoclostridium pacaense]MCC2874779.1 SIS domain-containing protein [Lachnoclostridium pacaense]
MVKFDEQAILENGAYIYAMRQEIEAIADTVCGKGFDNILFTASGGSLAMMQPFDYMISATSRLNVQSQVSAELLTTGNSHLTDRTIVFMASKSGDTRETVEAARYVKEKGATVISVLGVEGSPLGGLSDHTVIYKDGRPQEYVLYMLVGRILYNMGYFDDYVQFADELKNLPAALVSVGKESDGKAREYAMKYKDDSYQIWIGSGNLWGPTYSFAMCVLEESQWLRTKSVTSPEFFHGTIELVEKGVCVALNMTEGQTRVLDERVKNFVQEHTDDFTVFDTADYQLPGISRKFRWLLSPVVINAVLSRVSKNFEEIRNHSLDIRRYYRKLEY